MPSQYDISQNGSNVVVVGFTRVKCPPEAQNILPKAIERIRRQQVYNAAGRVQKGEINQLERTLC
jgi:hypothetical protein